MQTTSRRSGYQLLGRSGLRVSELALGTMTFGSDWGWGADLDESRSDLRSLRRGRRQLHRHRVQLHGRHERAVRRRARRRRSRPVRASRRSTRCRSIATIRTPAGTIGRASCGRSSRASGASQTDYVDLLWLHMRDDLTPIEEAVRALDDQVRLGKVLLRRHLRLARLGRRAGEHARRPARLVARSSRSRSPTAPRVVTRSASSFPMAASLGLAVVPWGVLRRGSPDGKPTRSAAGPRTASRSGHRAGRRRSARGRRGARVHARRRSRSPGPGQRPVAAHVIPIVAATREEQIVENLAAAEHRRSSRPRSRRSTTPGRHATRLPARLSRVHGSPRPHLRRHVRPDPPARGARRSAATIGSARLADVAQLVEHFTRNEGVRGSSPRVGFEEPPGNGRFFIATILRSRPCS